MKGEQEEISPQRCDPQKMSNTIEKPRLRLVKDVSRNVPFRSHGQTAVRTVGTVSGANVIGTLCDIVTREHTTHLSQQFLASIRG